ncbi:hypothetical protein MYA98_11690 [Salmonella sp. WGH-01]|nr:hypothetical protein MYA98_11690 [Salmonella sp. WGH-01]
MNATAAKGCCSPTVLSPFSKSSKPKTDQVRQRSALPHQHHRAEQRSLTAR